jgi:hypothetical protein
MADHVDRAALACRWSQELAKERIGGFVESDAAGRRFAAANFALQFKEPVLGEILRVREAFNSLASTGFATSA